jgi:hypothetical protein
LWLLDLELLVIVVTDALDKSRDPLAPFAG